MIIKEQEIKNRLKAKGVLVGIDDAGLHIQDEKSGEMDTLSFDDLRIFIDKTITISVADSTKKEIEPEFVDEETESDNE